MSGNGYGNARLSRFEDMHTHDECPPLLRELACYSVAKWSSEFLLKRWSRAIILKGFSWNDARLQASFARSMTKAERQDTLSDYGPTHPEAVPE